HAMRVSRKSRPRSEANIDGSVESHPMSRASAPAIALRRKATSDTDRAMGPLTLMLSRGNGVGAVGTSPTLGRSATTLLKLAGLRSEPPRSVPSAMGSSPAASAAPAPPLEPPALLDRSYGLRVVPYTSL